MDYQGNATFETEVPGWERGIARIEYDFPAAYSAEPSSANKDVGFSPPGTRKARRSLRNPYQGIASAMPSPSQNQCRL
jgi:hypothetical protein